MNSYNIFFSLLAAYMSLLLACPARAAAHESMKQMPMAKESRVYQAGAKEDFAAEKGFGDQKQMVEAMDSMMVEGDHANMDMTSNMAMNDAMDMGGGKMNMAMSHSRQEKQSASHESQYKFTVTLSPNPPIAGRNRLELQILNKKTDKPMSKLHLKAQVFMTEMNMGVSEPKVEEKSPGRYIVSPTFAMAGSWALKLYNDKGFEKTMQFDAGSKKKWIAPKN